MSTNRFILTWVMFELNNKISYYKKIIEEYNFIEEMSLYPLLSTSVNVSSCFGENTGSW